MYKLGILQFAVHPSLDMFRELAIQQLARKGFVEGKNLLIESENAQGSTDAAADIASRFVSDSKDAIFCISSPACIAVARATDSIPVVFGYVTDALAARLVTTLDAPGGNITGTLAPEPVDGQMRMVELIIPFVKKIGVIWSPDEPNSQVIVGQMQMYASQNDITLVEAHVDAPTEVAGAARSLVDRVDVLFVPGDNTAQAALPAVLQICEAHTLPVFASDAYNVDQGAIAAYSYSAEELAQQTGDMLAAVLGGQNPGEISVGMPTQFMLHLNLQAARRMGVTISDVLIEMADRVIR